MGVNGGGGLFAPTWPPLQRGKWGVGIIAGLFIPGLAAVPLLPQSMRKKAMLPCIRNWYRDGCGGVVRIPPSQVWPESLSEYVTFPYF
jgi:hypothetical protein